jgi:hypothetical protein
MPESRQNEFERLLETLSKGAVEYIIVGGVAGVIHGSVRLTQDLDIVYRRTTENMDRLVSALGPHRPYLRGAPAGLPFQWDVRTLEAGVNFTLTTDLGFVDLLGEITGGGSYGELLPHAVTVEAFGVRCLCLDLPSLIRVKRAAGRPRDLEAIAELEAILEETREP